MGKRRKLHEYSAENDIRYRGPLSYQGFQILGWLCIALSQVVVVMTFSGTDAALISGPDVISRGFVYEKESDQLMEELRRIAVDSLDYCQAHNITDWSTIKGKVKSGLSGYLYKTTKRSPMILPVIMEV